MTARCALLLCLCTAAPLRAEEAGSNASYQRYHVEYVVNADASSVETDEVVVLVNTKAGVDQWSQVRLDYSEKMQALEVLEAYTLSPDGSRHDVPADKIYSQESYSSAAAAMYADRKVKVIVFPNLAPGTRLAYRVRLTQKTPYFPGYFGLWEVFSVFIQYDDARVTLTAPRSLPMQVWSRDVQDGEPQTLDGDRRRWTWRYRRLQPMQAQSRAAEPWEYSPQVMASTYADYGRIGLAYQKSAAGAAQVTPKVRALADSITAGIVDRRAQAAAIYEWVAQKIRYVAIYLGNGGYEPNPVDDVLGNRYGDCKDHVAALQALLAAKGIASTPVLIGAGSGPTLPRIAALHRFNHVIGYLPEFDLYLDATSPYARFGQLPSGDLGAPVVHTVDGRLARTPASAPQRTATRVEAEYRFERGGDLVGSSRMRVGGSLEIGVRSIFSQITSQIRARFEESTMAGASLTGTGKLTLEGDPEDLRRPFGYRFDFQAEDYLDFSVVGGMTLPLAPAANTMRDIHASAASERNDTPFYCTEGLQEEIYTLHFPDDVPIIAIPRNTGFSNAAGDYSATWSRDGQTVVSRHRLHVKAVRGPEALCRPEDYPAFRALYHQVRRAFRGQVLYGDLSRMQAGGGASRER